MAWNDGVNNNILIGSVAKLCHSHTLVSWHRHTHLGHQKISYGISYAPADDRPLPDVYADSGIMHEQGDVRSFTPYL